MKYLDHMPAMALHDYNGRVVSPDGLDVFSICGHDICPPIIWVTPYIEGEPPHSRRAPSRLSPEAVRVPLHFREGFGFALHWYCQHTTSAQRCTIPDWGAIHHRHLYGKTTATDRLQLARECARFWGPPRDSRPYLGGPIR